MRPRIQKELRLKYQRSQQCGSTVLNRRGLLTLPSVHPGSLIVYYGENRVRKNLALFLIV